jgi:predicted nuclease of predicted toxin-antitoxin system
LKIIVDMNMSPRWATFLTERGHEAKHWRDIGNADDGDELIAEHCASANAVVLSQDLDFSGLLSWSGAVKPSVVQVRAKNLRPEEIGQFVANAISRTEKQLAKGAVVTVKPPRFRYAMLPLGQIEDED